MADDWHWVCVRLKGLVEQALVVCAAPPISIWLEGGVLIGVSPTCIVASAPRPPWPQGDLSSLLILGFSAKGTCDYS